MVHHNSVHDNFHVHSPGLAPSAIRGCDKCFFFDSSVLLPADPMAISGEGGAPSSQNRVRQTSGCKKCTLHVIELPILDPPIGAQRLRPRKLGKARQGGHFLFRTDTLVEENELHIVLFALLLLLSPVWSRFPGHFANQVVKRC